MKQLSRWIGGGCFLLAFVLFTAIVVNPMRLGGNAWCGKVEEGRYFVVAKGHRYTEVSEAEWRIEQALEWCFFVPLPLIWIGMAFWSAAGGVPNEPIPTALPPFPLWMSLANIGITALGAGAGWVVGRAPWTAFFGAWLAFWFSAAWITWLYARSTLPQPRDVPGDAASGGA
jgi:hypothetical protein